MTTNFPTECPKCAGTLSSVEDYTGGGSHYWILKCGSCECRFSYDTYSFELNEMGIGVLIK